MRPRPAQRTTTVCLCTALLAACATSVQHRQADLAPIHRISRPQPQIAQLAFGPDAAYAACIGSECPARTPKTLAGGIAGDSIASSGFTDEPSGGRLLATGSIRRVASVEAAAPPRTEQLSVRFPFAAATLTADARRTLLEALPLARQANRILISGRTDGAGPQGANDRIAHLRAVATRDFLQAQLGGAAPELVIDAKGGCCFVADDSTPAGRALNRRVDVVISIAQGLQG